VSAVDTRWLAEHREGERSLFRIGARGDVLVAEWPGVGTLEARRDGSDASLTFAEDCPSIAREKISRGSARLLLHHVRGGLAMHGACVGEADRAVVLLGRSGAGKSSLAAAACRAGLALLADDAVLLGLPEGATDSVRVEATERAHLLDDAARRALAMDRGHDAFGGKSAVDARATLERAAVVALVDLRFDDGAPRLELLEGTAALQALVPQVARFVLDDPCVQMRELEQLAVLMTHTPIFRLARPFGFGYIDGAVSLVQRALLGDTPRMP
jgi:hypothetical protein